MPGITGFISSVDPEKRRASLDQMLGCMMHERFYSSGTLVEEKFDLAAGWVCQTGTASDCRPIWDEQRNVCLLFVGEHFPAALNAKLDGERKSEDTRHLVQLYEKHGMEFLKELNGIFTGLLIDYREQKGILFNDRFGMGRIYYHQSERGFYFASEAKSLLKILPQLRQLDNTGLAEFFSCGSVLQDRSLFAGVSLLPPASVCIFRPQRPVAKECYFNPESWEEQKKLPEREYYERLKETFARILPRYFMGKEQIALSLTGGLDSRMIIACADSAPGKLPCYTFGGMYRECADVRLAKKIARETRQTHEVIPVTSEFFSEFPDLAQQSVYYTDGAMDVTGSVELFANRIARKIAPVRLTGNYGSEILRGNIAFKPASLWEPTFDSKFTQLLKEAGTTYMNERAVNRASFIAFKQVPWHHYARFAVEQSQLTVRSPFLDNQLVQLSYQAPANLSLNKELTHRLIAERYPELAKIPTDRGRMLRPGISAKWTALRQEFMPRAEYVYDYGMPQWLAKADRLLAPLHLERLFLGRQKFTHFRVWYRNELSAYVKELLLDPRTLTRPYLNRRHVEEIVGAHVTGRGNYTLEIHKLLTSELIQRHLIEQN